MKRAGRVGVRGVTMIEYVIVLAAVLVMVAGAMKGLGVKSGSVASQSTVTLDGRSESSSAKSSSSKKEEVKEKPSESEKEKPSHAANSDQRQL